MRIAICGMVLSLLMAGAAFAQNPPPATAPPASSKTMAPSTMAPTAMDKKAISKSCTDQANAKGLHGKERKKFRSACKKNGGKAS